MLIYYYTFKATDYINYLKTVNLQHRSRILSVLQTSGPSCLSVTSTCFLFRLVPSRVQCCPKVRCAPASTVSWRTTAASSGRRPRQPSSTAARRRSLKPSSASTSYSGAAGVFRAAGRSVQQIHSYSPPPVIFFFCSAVEQPDVIFSIEQIRCSRQLNTEPQSSAITAEDCGTDDMCDSEPESEHLAGSGQTEDAGSNPGSAADLFLKLKEKPEELLQLAPGAGGQRRSGLLQQQWWKAVIWALYLPTTGTSYCFV